MMYEKSNSVFSQISNVLYENRYCNQEGFSILVFGGKDKNGKVTNEVLELEIPSFELKKFPSMVKPHRYLDLVVNVKSDILAICDRTYPNESLDKSSISVEIYSEKTKNWTHKYVEMEKRYGYCVSSFISKLYIIGGHSKSIDRYISLCYTYDVNSNTWNEISGLNKARDCAACTVFEGKIVVTGGEYNWTQLTSVETYDYYEDKWTCLPDLLEGRCNHAVVSMVNKMFVIGGEHTTSCEVFDSCSRKFTKIISEIQISDFREWYFKAFNIGNNIVIIQDCPESLEETVVYSYDVDKAKWLNIQSDLTKRRFKLNYVKYFSN